MNLEDKVAERLAALRQAYAAELPARVASLSESWRRVKEGGWPETEMQELVRAAHGLVGSGATFGYQQVSAAARAFEDAVRGWSIADAPGPEELAHAETRLAELQAVVQVSAPAEQMPAPESSPHQRLIFLVESDMAAGRHLAMQLRQFGYRVKHFTSPAQVQSALHEEPPAALIVDVVFHNDELGGIRALEHWRAALGQLPPAIFLSARDDVTARLEAVRAGGAAYFIKPADISSLVDRLDALTRPYKIEPFRVLIVEDDLRLGEYYKSILTDAGMLAELITDPLSLLSQLDQFFPEVILLDVHIPQCTGVELAAVIRQKESYLGVPIVFLPSEDSRDQQWVVMEFGADDFLPNPIAPDHLVSTVQSRAERYRRLRSLMLRDSLTGVLNHTAIKEQLASEIARQRREGGRCSFAMIDLDRFKAVNDVHGHAAGDRVIKSLTRMLRERLRQSDAVGRYGGEEFAIVLPNVDGESARRLLDGLREDFARLTHQSAQGEFRVTFSGGIAEFPRYDTSALLMEAADRALYAAKRGGRDRIEVATA